MLLDHDKGEKNGFTAIQGVHIFKQQLCKCQANISLGLKGVTHRCRFVQHFDPGLGRLCCINAVVLRT